MAEDNEATILEPKTEPGLDAKWHARLKEVASFQATGMLDGDQEKREKQKALFLAGQIDNPVLDYPKLDGDDLEKNDQALSTLKHDIVNNEPDELIRQVYRWRINEKLAEIRMLKATLDGDMHRFRKYNEFIYGSPSKDIFAYTVTQIRQELAEAMSSGDSLKMAAAQEISDLLPDLEAVFFPMPDEETRQLVKNQTEAEFGELVSIPDQKEKLEAEAVKSVFEQALDGVRAEGWSVIVDSQTSRTGIFIDSEKKQVVIPEGRQVTAKKLKQLVLHEIGTHVLRREQGKRSKLRLLGLGLDRHTRGEEGVAKMREQTLEANLDEFSGTDGHFAISLAQGLDGHKRDFRAVFMALSKYYRFKNIKKGLDPEEAESQAKTSAWNRTMRTFRGTDGKTPGTAFAKDIVYREGNIAVWDVVRDNPEEMMRFSVGKYDPSNSRHIWVLDSLGISDEDLKELEDGRQK